MYLLHHSRMGSLNPTSWISCYSILAEEGSSVGEADEDICPLNQRPVLQVLRNYNRLHSDLILIGSMFYQILVFIWPSSYIPIDTL